MERAGRTNQILAATCQIIAQHGFRSMRVSDVAKLIGTASGTIHYHFPTKRALLHAAFEYNFRHSLQRRKEILDSSADPVDKLRNLIDSYIPEGEETVRAWRVWAELWIEAVHDPDLEALNETIYGEYRTVMATIIRDGHSHGQIVASDAVAQANMTMGLIDGLAIQVLMGSSSMDASRMRAVCHSFVDSALLNR